MFCILFGAFSKSTKIPTSTIKISPVVYIQKIILVTLNFKYLNGNLSHKNNEHTTKKTETHFSGVQLQDKRQEAQSE